jgi:hypothetical protein
MNKTTVLSAFALLVLAGCQAQLKVPGISTGGAPANEPTEAAPEAASEPAPAKAKTASKGAAAEASPKTPEPSEGERESEREIKHQLERAEEIAKTGKVYVSDAVSGFDANDRIKFVTSFYKAPATVPEKVIERLKDAMKKQVAAAESAAKKENLSKPAAADAGAQKAIRADFEKRLPGVQIKSVYMTDAGWKVNYTDYGAIRNRYKNAEVVIQIKGSTACLAVPANAAQAHMGGGTYSTEYLFDEFTQGFAVPCK